MKIVALVLGVLALLSFSPLVAHVAAQTGCGSPGVNAEGAIVLTGDGQMNTRPFDLQAAAYTVRWSGSAPNKIVPGNLILTLKRTDGPYPQELLLNTTISKGDPEMSGETQVYLTKAGAHYLDVNAPAGWSVTITPQR
jgi:hypothetical protein